MGCIHTLPYLPANRFDGISADTVGPATKKPKARGGGGAGLKAARAVLWQKGLVRLKRSRDLSAKIDYQALF